MSDQKHLSIPINWADGRGRSVGGGGLTGPYPEPPLRPFSLLFQTYQTTFLQVHTDSEQGFPITGSVPSMRVQKWLAGGNLILHVGLQHLPQKPLLLAQSDRTQAGHIDGSRVSSFCSFHHFTGTKSRQYLTKQDWTRAGRELGANKIIIFLLTHRTLLERHKPTVFKCLAFQ